MSYRAAPMEISVLVWVFGIRTRGRCGVKPPSTHPKVHSFCYSRRMAASQAHLQQQLKGTVVADAPLSPRLRRQVREPHAGHPVLVVG